MEIEECKIGMCVKITKDESNQPWYTEDIFTIVGFTTNNMKIKIILIDKYLKNTQHEYLKNTQHEPGNAIHQTYLFRDKECKMKERKLKLKILEEINGKV